LLDVLLVVNQKCFLNQYCSSDGLLLKRLLNNKSYLHVPLLSMDHRRSKICW